MSGAERKRVRHGGAGLQLATALRAFCRRFPEALTLQAAGDVVPPTVAQHLGAGVSRG